MSDKATIRVSHFPQDSTESGMSVPYEESTMDALDRLLWVSSHVFTRTIFKPIAYEYTFPLSGLS